MGVLVTEAGVWGAYENRILAKLQDEGIPVILVFNKTNLLPLHAAGGADGLMELCREGIPAAARGLPAVCMAASERKGVAELRQALLDNAPDGFVNAPAILSDIVPAGSVVVLVTPHRQGGAARKAHPAAGADHTRPARRRLHPALRPGHRAAGSPSGSRGAPRLGGDRFQAFGSVAAMVPDSIPLTGFSVAFARNKGDLLTQAMGTLAIAGLTEESRVLIAEACTHHPSRRT